MVKVLLINPYNPDSDHVQPPLGLGYLATSLRNSHFEVNILDANKEKININGLKDKIVKLRPKVIGFQVFTTNINFVKEGLKIVKKIDESIVTLVGGPHVSALPSEIFKIMGKDLDFAFRGEAEIGLPLLLKKFSSKNRKLENIPGLIYRKNQRVIVNKPLFFQNLDNFGSPAWDLLKPQTYPEAQHGAFFRQFPIAPIITTRGCPFNCSFCAGKLSTGTMIRKRNVGAVIEEIKNLYNNYKIREFQIVDDNFTFDKSYAKKILKEISKLKLKASFSVPNGVRLDTLDKEILFLMKQAGFYLISVGIESGSDRILKSMNKHLMTRQIKEKIHLIKSVGLKCAGFFILGFPGETEEEIKKTIEFSLNLGLLRAYFFVFVPLPGTPIAQKLYNNGKFNPSDFNNFSFTSPFFSDQLSKKRLKHWQRKAFLKFYLFRPKILFENLMQIKRIPQIYFFAKRAFRWMK